MGIAASMAFEHLALPLRNGSRYPGVPNRCASTSQCTASKS